MQIKNRLLFAGCVLASAAMLPLNLSCNNHELNPFSQSLSAGQKQAVSSGSTRAVDILFVIDDSNSMTEEQASLDENFKTFIGQLQMAGADYRLAAVTTSYNKGTMPFVTTGPWNQSASSAGLSGAQILNQNSGLNDTEISKIKAECEQYFNDKKWIQSTDFDSSDTQKILNLFRCESMNGTGGSANETGLLTMYHALIHENASASDPTMKSFKRPGSLLAIVFVTDENDCSASYSDMTTKKLVPYQNQNIDKTKNELKRCENERNIEDSCIVTKNDSIFNGNDNTPSTLKLSSGQVVSFTTADGEQITNLKKVYEGLGLTPDDTFKDLIDTEITQKPLRDVCVDGSLLSRAILTACVNAYSNPDNAGGISCSAGQNIQCPEGGCKNVLNSRRDFYDAVINTVAVSNLSYYEKANANILPETLTSEEREAVINDLARQDVIIANIINRDKGKRYDSDFVDTWCAGSGSESYRYQLFGEMFRNDPIFAPICCMSSERVPYTAAYSVDDKMSIQAVCTGSETDDTNSQFGPALGAIGRRIGEAINTLCTDSTPITCNPKDCNVALDSDTPSDDPSPACPCNYGCKASVKYFADNPDKAYYLCNEFSLNVGAVPAISIDASASQAADSLSNYTSYNEGKDYTVDYESNYCMTRTGSPIQINLNKNEPGKSIVIAYPKKVSSI